VGLTVDFRQAEAVLDRAARKAASDDPVDPLWEQRARELEEWPSNRVGIAAFGTALLAKAANPDIDPLSLTEDSGPCGYRPRNLAKMVLAARREDYRYALGTPAPDPLAASPWFGDVARIDLITKWRAQMRVRADRLVSWLGSLRADEAETALVAFLRVRMEIYRERQQLSGLSQVDATRVSYGDLVGALKPFIESNPEEGRRGAALVAAAFEAAGYEVVARPVNDPGQLDVDIRKGGELVMGIEVKQKPATAQDARDIAQGAAQAGASKALLCALDPRQERLDGERLVLGADSDYAVVLEIVYDVGSLLRLAIFSSAVRREDFLARLPGDLARQLEALNASAEARSRWKTTADRWAQSS
jgi:hypothetical protein